MDQNAIRVADSRDIFQLSWSLRTPSFQNLQSSGDSCSDPALSTGNNSRSGDNRGHSLHPIICVENNTNMLAWDKFGWCAARKAGIVPRSALITIFIVHAYFFGHARQTSPKRRACSLSKIKGNLTSSKLLSKILLHLLIQRLR